MPLQARGVTDNDAAVFTEKLADVLLRTGKVRVMERSQMDKILAEQGFQSSGACDSSECAIQMGRLLGIERIVVGSVGKVGETYSLSLRLVDVATGEVQRSANGSLRGAIDDALHTVVRNTGNELLGSLEGRGAKREASNTWIWWTTGGLVVAGGTAAAVVLLMDDGSPATTPSNPGPKLAPVTVELP